MNGIVIAAGRGTRMWPYTQMVPKCMLPIDGEPLLSHIVKGLRGAGCNHIAIITGYLADKVQAPGCYKIFNSGYLNNNILHSLMYARSFLNTDVVVSYSDIFVEPIIYKRLVSRPGEIVIALDTDWKSYYEGRTEHPMQEAEKALIPPTYPKGGARVVGIGKSVQHFEGRHRVCEFTGLWKMSAVGANKFRAKFEELDTQLSPMTPFRGAGEWQKAYVTDLMSEMIDCGVTVDCLLIKKGWAELDTPQDYERLAAIAMRQRLTSLAMY
jgi:L-glutamine-phosphate cytidylyltransferase